MLHAKFHTCFKESWKKNVDIYCISGSNDFIAINFYKNIALKYNSEKKQIFGLNKVKNFNLIASNKTVTSLSYNKILFWNLDYGKLLIPDFDNKLTGCIFAISKDSIKDKKEKILYDIAKSGQAFNELYWEKIFVGNGCEVEDINAIFSVNYKVGSDLTTIEMVKQTIGPNLHLFSKEDKKIIFDICNKFWNNILDL